MVPPTIPSAACRFRGWASVTTWRWRFPGALGAFRVPGGASAYFHGGMSPQELAIPVLSLIPKQTAASAAPSADVEWDIRLGSRKITTRVISVRVGGRSAASSIRHSRGADWR